MNWEITPEKYLTQNQVKKLFSVCERLSNDDADNYRDLWCKVWMAVHLAFSTGMRCSEVCNIKLKDIVLDGDEPRLHVVRGKRGKSRFIPLGDLNLRTHLTQYLAYMSAIGYSCNENSFLFQSRKGGKYSTNGMAHLFSLAYSQSGIDGFSTHSARHSFAVAHYQKNLDLRGLQKILGHSSPTTTTVYADRPFHELIKSTSNIY